MRAPSDNAPTAGPPPGPIGYVARIGRVVFAKSELPNMASRRILHAIQGPRVPGPGENPPCRLPPMSVTLTVAVCLLIAGTATACPTCKQGIVEGANHDQLMRGYFWSILFMMSMPFLILGGLSAYFYAAVCRARREASRSDIEQIVAVDRRRGVTA